ncbi:MAG: caspase family protein [Gemmatimonadetes bacterium]|nr:caspase family protein [Gemmatimonadota bacterium]
MPRAVSIHVGVNYSQDRYPGRPLRHSEDAAWRMAQLANRAGYLAVRVLRGVEATCGAVTDAMEEAAHGLAAGDTLFLSYSGHGSREPDANGDDGDGCDEAWCLYDGILPDDKLVELWRRFSPGVRILVVAESCFGGGGFREGEGVRAVARRPVMRGGPVMPSVMSVPTTCIAEAPHDAYGIRASILAIAAAREDQTARDGVFMEELMGVWNDGAYAGSFCDLFREVRQRVMARAGHEPQIMMLGAPDLGFPLEPAFHLNRPVMRGRFRGAYR